MYQKTRSNALDGAAAIGAGGAAGGGGAIPVKPTSHTLKENLNMNNGGKSGGQKRFLNSAAAMPGDADITASNTMPDVLNATNWN